MFGSIIQTRSPDGAIGICNHHDVVANSGIFQPAPDGAIADKPIFTPGMIHVISIYLLQYSGAGRSYREHYLGIHTDSSIG